MRVVFDCSLDGSAWPGPLGNAGAVYGEVWVGPNGLLDLLEARLGLGGNWLAPLPRACHLMRLLETRSGYWHESFQVDPLGTARRLLADRDQLWLWGWTGQAVSKRLGALSDATEGASPGSPDRLLAIVSALGDRRSGIATVASYTAIADLPPLWQRVFSALKESGVVVEHQLLTPADAVGDLAASRTRGFAPKGDGRLCLLRRHGPLDLADEVAASLAACDDLQGIVIVGADDVLDQALERHGLPRVGASNNSPASSDLIRLVIACAFRSVRMSDLHAMLAADPGPIPRSIARRLLDALRRVPGRSSVGWDEELAASLAKVDEERRERVEQRVKTLLTPECEPHARLPLSSLLSRMQVLRAWALSRAGHVRSLLLLASRVTALVEAVEMIGQPDFSMQELRELCDDLGEPRWARREAQAGFGHVDRPGAILAPARAIVWWNFSRDAVQRPPRMLLSKEDRDGLHAANIAVPDPARAVTIESQSWTRPLMQAQESLVLACPRHEPDGEANHAHPLWDDVVASLADYRDASKLERTEILHLAPAKREVVALRDLPTTAATVQLANPVMLRDLESPSSIDKLIGCSMAWALSYRASLQPSLADGPSAVGPLVFGNVAHRILEQVLEKDWASPDEAGREVDRLLDEQLTDLCEELGLPQHQADRATVRGVIGKSARDLVRLANEHRVTGAKTELEGTATLSGQSIHGRIDLVWPKPPAVIDLKWGRSSNAAKLEAGTAIQLAAYAEMMAGQGPRPEIAYYALNVQRVLAPPGGVLAAGSPTGEHTAAEMWSAAAASFERCRDSLAAGRLVAPGAEGDEVKSSFAPDGLVVKPPCDYCDFATLCGREAAQ